VQRRCLVFGFLGSFKGAIAVPRGSGRIASYRRVARGPGAHPPGVRVLSALIQEVAPNAGPSIGASRSRPAAEDCPIGALGGIFGRFDSSGPGAPFRRGGLWRARDRGPLSIVASKDAGRDSVGPMMLAGAFVGSGRKSRGCGRLAQGICGAKPQKTFSLAKAGHYFGSAEGHE